MSFFLPFYLQELSNYGSQIVENSPLLITLMVLLVFLKVPVSLIHLVGLLISNSSIVLQLSSI